MTLCVSLDAQAAAGLARGMRQLGALARLTLGPDGRGVITEGEGGRPRVAMDAWSICQQLELEDHLADSGVRIARDAAFRLVHDTGDGAATMLVMCCAGLEAGLKALAGGYSHERLKAEVRAAATRVERSWDPLVKAIASKSELIQLASLAADGDEELGRLIGGGLFDLGSEGFVTVEEGYGRETELEVRKGAVFDAALASRHLLGEAKEIALEAPYVLLHEGPINDFGSMARILEGFAQSRKSLVIIASAFGDEALATLILNRRELGLEVAAANAPGVARERASLLGDLAVLTGAETVGPATGSSLEALRPRHLGQVNQAVVDLSSIRLIEGAGAPESVAAHCEALRCEIEREKYLAYDREVLQRRLARFTSGIAILRVGAASHAEAEMRRERAKRATKSVRAALGEGTLPGGGAAFASGIRALAPSVRGRTPEAAAARVVRAMLEAPLAALAENAGVEARPMLARVLAHEEDGIGFSVRLRAPAAMREEGVIDALPVVRDSFRTAVSLVVQMAGLGAAVTGRNRAPVAGE